MVSFAEELEKYIDVAGLDAKVTIGHAPPKPDRCITVFQSPAGGFAPDNDMGAVNPLIVVQCRDAGEINAESLAWKVHNMFNDRQTYSVGAVYVVSSRATLSPIRVGRDENNRTLYNVNLWFKIETPK